MSKLRSQGYVPANRFGLYTPINDQSFQQGVYYPLRLRAHRIRFRDDCVFIGRDEACPKTPSFLTPQVADSRHSIFVSFACPKIRCLWAGLCGPEYTPGTQLRPSVISHNRTWTKPRERRTLRVR